MATRKQPSDLSLPQHSANVACYLLEIDTRKVYSLTNKHVTLQAEEIYIKKNDQKEQTKLGTSFQTSKNISLDVGLIHIDPLVEGRVRNKETPTQHIRLYSDSFPSIFGKEVFKYKPSGNNYEICHYDTCNSGVVASESEHKYVKNGQFLVKGTSGDFATNGESGTAIAVKAVEGGEGSMTELIGLLCGGSGCYTVCLFLPFVIQCYERQFGIKLQLYEIEKYNSDFKINEKQNNCLIASKDFARFSANPYIPCGIKIYFICLTPEQIAPLEFDLVNHALALLCLDFTPIDLGNYEHLVKRQNDLSLLVNERGTFSEIAIFENDRPEFVAVEKGIRACDCLFLGKAVEAEKHLKLAILCVRKSEDLGSRLLCKLVTYITWYCLVQNSHDSLNDLERLLTEGIETFESSDFKDKNGFPVEALGYMYFDFSRYYMTKWENKCREMHEEKFLSCTNGYRVKAVEKAKQAMTIFQLDYKNQETPDTKRRLVLAKCQAIYSLLGCGHNFDSSEVIKNAEIKEAEEIFESIHKDMNDMPMVQNTDYLLSLCDLQFRKGCVAKALDAAQKCLMISGDKGQIVALHRAKCRVEILSML